MNNLHLLILGSSEEEIRENTRKALDDAFKLYGHMGDQANCLSPEEYEFEFCEEKYMADLMEKYMADVIKLSQT